MEYVKSDFDILEAIISSKASNPYTALTIKELIDISKYSHTKVRSSIRVLMAKKYIDEGFMKKNAKTYYVKDAGIELMAAFKK